MIGIIDLGLGNIRSISNAFLFLQADVQILEQPKTLDSFKGLVLPGVGAFGNGCNALDSGNWREPIKAAVLYSGIPLLGICLGMQLLASTSQESPGYLGLGLVEGESCLIPSHNYGFRIPQIGWNEVLFKKTCKLFEDIGNPVFYFLHSYYVKLKDEAYITSTVDYGGEITASISSSNIYAVQFHPEKSQEAGLKVLSNFLKTTELS